MITASTYGKNRPSLIKALSERLPFNTGGSLKGRAYGDIKPPYAGTWLTGTDLTAWAIDHNSVTYVVWSYDTPIAWVTRSADGTDHVHHVDQSFSRTTSKHQGQVRCYLK